MLVNFCKVAVFTSKDLARAAKFAEYISCVDF